MNSITSLSLAPWFLREDVFSAQAAGVGRQELRERDHQLEILIVVLERRRKTVESVSYQLTEATGSEAKRENLRW